MVGALPRDVSLLAESDKVNEVFLYHGYMNWLERRRVRAWRAARADVARRHSRYKSCEDASMLLLIANSLSEVHIIGPYSGPRHHRTLITKCQFPLGNPHYQTLVQPRFHS